MALTDNIRFRQGSLAALGRQDITNGSLWFTTDEGAIYLDVNDKRVRFGDYVTVDSVAQLPTAGHAYETALYYAKAENVLARWDKQTNKWVQLNAAGLSKIVVNGTGNVLAGATVTLDAETGAKVLTFSTETVATSTELNGLKTRVTSLEARADKIEAKLTGIADGETVMGKIGAVQTDLQGKIDAVDALADQGIADAKAAKEYAEGVQTNLNNTNTRLGAAEADIDALQAAIGEGGSVDEKIAAAKEELLGTAGDAAGEDTIHGALNAAAAAQEAADDAQDTADGAAAQAAQNKTDIGGLNTRLTAAEADIDGLQAAVNTLNADDKTEGSVDYKVAQEVAKILNDNDASDIDTLEEIASWITNDTTGAASMAKDIADIKSKNQSQDTLIQGLDAEIDANKQAAETAVSNLETKLIGDAETYTDLGKAEDAIVAAKAQADKGVADAKAASDAAAQVQTNLNNTNTRVGAAEADIDDLQSRMTTAEGEIDALQAADTAIRGEFAAADTALENKLKGDAATYTDLGKAEDAIQANAGSINTINTNIQAIQANLTWETFE